jgi:hypothetical protein
MSFDARCPQCLFVTRQLGQLTPCLLHVSLAPAGQAEASEDKARDDYDEPYTFGNLRLSVDRPGPFTLREYVRLLLLRTRVQTEPSRLDAPSPRAHARSLSRRSSTRSHVAQSAHA